MKLLRLLLVGIIILGFLLRYNNLNTWPRLGATFDEYAWTWQGISILSSGVPSSWSPLPSYTKFKNIEYQKTHFRIVTPYLEHPPLFGLVAGSFAMLSGVKDMYHLDIQSIRLLALALGTLSIFSLYLFTTEVFNRKVGLIAALLYATIPTIAIGSRIVQNENFFIPFWLLALFCITKYIRTKNKLLRNIGILIASLLVLAKIPWGAASLSIILLFLSEKKYKDAFITFLSAVGAVFLIVLYGAYYDFNLFANLLLFQSVRYDLTFSSIFALFQKPYLVDRFYTDGWIYFGWLMVPFIFIGDIKRKIFVIAPILSYFIVFLSGIPDEAGHGWYRYPFYPFLVIAIALFFAEHFRKNVFLTFIFLSIVGSSLLQNTFGYVFGFSYIIFRLSILSWMVPLSSYFFHKEWYKRLGNVITVFWFCLFIILNIISIMLYNEQ